jgi:hypothetical protein
MKTKLFLQALSLAIVILTSARIKAQTVVWERKAFGQTQSHPCGGTFTWPNNNFWGQQEVILTECNSAFVAAPSNWSTASYPDGAGVNVILGAGGAAGTNLNQQTVTLNSLTIQSVGALNISFGSAITANSFVFEGDGAITNQGGGGSDPFLTINSGGSMTKSGGSGSFTLPLNLVLQSSNATFSSLSGSLVLSTIVGTQANPTFHANAGASVVLVAPNGTQTLSGNVQGTGAGTISHSAGRLFPGPGGVEFNFAGASFQWTGGSIEAADPARLFVNKGTINVAGVTGVYGHNITNSGLMVQSGAGALNLPYGTTVTNSALGTFDLKTDNGLTAIGGGGANPTFQNQGVLRKSGGTGTSVLQSGLVVKNSGTIDIQTGTLQIWLFEQTSGTTSLNGGNLTFIDNEAQFNGGSLVGSGTITGSVRNNGATFAPGFSPGKIMVNGNYAQTATGILNLEIGGTTPGTQYDQLVVSGNAALGGTLNLSLINGYQPAGGETFQLLLPGFLTGTFATVNTIGFTGTVTYSSSGITITVTTPTPTPTSTPGPTPTATPSATATATPSATATATPSATATATPSATATPTPSATATATPSATATATPSATATATPSATATATPSATATATPSATATATPSATATATPSATATATPSATATATPTITPSATPTPSPSATPTPTATPSPTPGQLLNIATRLRVQTDDNVLIGGLIVTGTDQKKVLLRAIGPSLSPLFQGALANPILELYQGNTLLARNDDWKDSQQAEIEATTMPPHHELESAIVYTLPPGAYTAIMRGKGAGTGIGVVEAYDLDQAANAKLANLSTRGFVDSGDNVMIGGMIAGGNGGGNIRVLIRALGPSLATFGINGALQDPTLELRDGNGALLRENDNWQADQQGEIEATLIPPPNAAESAIVATLTPGNYTAVVRGKNETTGVALVEIYNIQ